MSSNLRLILKNEWDIATLSATNESLPIRHTQEERRDDPFESINTSDVVITATWDNPVQASGFGMTRHNLSSGATIQILLKIKDEVVYTNTEDLSQYIPAGVWRVGIDVPGATWNEQLATQQTAIWFDTQTFDSAIITIKNATNPDGYINIPRICLGLHWSPATNFDYGAALGRIENAKHTLMDSGGLYSEGGHADSRTFRIGLEQMQSETDFVDLWISLGKVGQINDFLLAAYPEGQGVFRDIHIFMARRVQDNIFQHAAFNQHDTEILFQEP